jgi:hypothetical protein
VGMADAFFHAFVPAAKAPSGAYEEGIAGMLTIIKASLLGSALMLLESCTGYLTRACTHKIAIGDSDLINVRIGPLCGLKSDISRGQRSANNGLLHVCLSALPNAPREVISETQNF